MCVCVCVCVCVRSGKRSDVIPPLLYIRTWQHNGQTRYSMTLWIIFQWHMNAPRHRGTATPSSEVTGPGFRETGKQRRGVHYPPTAVAAAVVWTGLDWSCFCFFVAESRPQVNTPRHTRTHTLTHSHTHIPHSQSDAHAHTHKGDIVWPLKVSKLHQL